MYWIFSHEVYIVQYVLSSKQCIALIGKFTVKWKQVNLNLSNFTVCVHFFSLLSIWKKYDGSEFWSIQWNKGFISPHSILHFILSLSIKFGSPCNSVSLINS